MDLTSPDTEKSLYFVHSIDRSDVRAYGKLIAQHCKDVGAILASVFVRRVDGISPTKGNRLVPTLAYQLVVSRRSPQKLKVEILGALHAEPDIPEKTMTIQFQKLIIHPLLNVANILPPTSPVIFVLESLHNFEHVEQVVNEVATAVAQLRSGGINAKAAFTGLSYHRLLTAFSLNNERRIACSIREVPVSNPPSVSSTLWACCFLLADFKYNLPEPVQRSVEDVSISCFAIGVILVTFWVPMMVMIAYSNVRLFLFSSLVALSLASTTGIYVTNMINAAIEREKARGSKPI